MTANARPPRPLWALPLWAILAALGTSALYGGGLLVLDPSGERLGLPAAWIQGTVFGSYLVPGVVLLVVLGLGSILVLAGLLLRRAWAWPVGVALGVATVGWILVEYAVVGHYFFLQPVIVGVGVLLVTLLALPSMRSYYRADATIARLRGR